METERAELRNRDQLQSIFYSLFIKILILNKGWINKTTKPKNLTNGNADFFVNQRIKDNWQMRGGGFFVSLFCKSDPRIFCLSYS